MKFEIKEETNFTYLIIDEMYDDDELKSIWEELHYLTNPRRMKGPKDTGGAFTPDGKNKKENFGIFLDPFFITDRSSSSILVANRKLFGDDIKKVWKDAHPYNIIWGDIDLDGTLLSYYENTHHYNLHHDGAAFTALTWLYKEPKRFEGGEFYFDGDIKVELKNNRTILFPSWVRHRVTSVSMEGSDGYSTYGRYSIAQFCHYARSN